VQAAADHCGALLTARSNNDVSSSGLGPLKANAAAANAVETVQLLAVNAFDSDRKMMSVLVSIAAADVGDNSTSSDKTEDVRYFLLCKGADSSMLALCDQDAVSSPHFTTCMQHIEQFACTGLRTLVAASREVDKLEAQQWLAEYKAAANSLARRSELLFECAKGIECASGLQLLGAIGIEDELQDDVAASIDLLHRAGLNVWMITGDKAETAIAIGKHCALVDPQVQQVERVLNLSGEALRQRILDLHAFVVLRGGRQEGVGQGGPVSGPAGGAPGSNNNSGPGGRQSSMSSQVSRGK
jgi:magnesium-transporting ATPase (P-type)